MNPDHVARLVYIDTALAAWAGFAARTLLRRVRSRHWPSVVGHVARAEPIYVHTPNIPGSAERTANVTYRYRVGSTDFVGNTLGGWADSLLTDPDALLQKYPVGQKVTVHYDPTDPRRALLRPGGSVADWLTFLVPVAGLVAATIALWPAT